jgi:hypothetical protein
VKDNVVVAFPRSHPFKQADFYPDPTFLSVDGIPIVLFPHAPVLVSYRDGKAQVVAQSFLKHDNHEGLCWREFADLVRKSAKDNGPARQPSAAKKTPPVAAQGTAKAKASDTSPHPDHPLNKLALAMLNRWSRRELPDLMPVLELALIAVPEGQEDGPEGQAFEKARRLAPATVLALLERSFQPEDLLDATDLQDAAQMILNEIEGFGEITDSQLYREREERE